MTERVTSGPHEHAERPGGQHRARSQYERLLAHALALEIEFEQAQTRLGEIRQAVRKPNGVITNDWYYEAVAKVAALAGSAASKDGENLAARVQAAHRLLDNGDPDEMIAWLIGAPLEDVRRVSGSAASNKETE